MCWVSEKFPTRNIADNVITCYKVFNKEDIIWSKIKSPNMTLKNDKILKMSSLLRKHTYIPWELNNVVNLYCECSNSYRYDDPTVWIIHKGYHSYATLDKAKIHTDPLRCIIKCLIPKDSEYYINEFNEVVSSNIIVTNQIIEYVLDI